MEYPGYGVYKNELTDSETLLSNARTVFDFVINDLKYKSEEVFLFGRSMGSGPACHLASLYEPCGLILLSPYTSLKDVVSSLVGRIPALLVKERFKNAEAISKSKCPALIIHGQAD